MYRLLIESLLGLRLEVDKLHFAPCFPLDWTSFKVHYRFQETVYHVPIQQSPDHEGEMHATIDGVPHEGKFVSLVNDHREHFVDLTFASARTPVLS